MCNQICQRSACGLNFFLGFDGNNDDAKYLKRDD